MSDTANTTAIPAQPTPLSHSGAQSPNSPQEHNSSTPSPSTPTSTTTPSDKVEAVGSPLPSKDVSSVTESLSNLTVHDPTSTPKRDVSDPDGSDPDVKKTEVPKELEEELSPEEAQLRAKGLKSTHRPGFYIHVDSPKRLRIQTKDKAFDLDRHCPHANADLLKWVCESCCGKNGCEWQWAKLIVVGWLTNHYFSVHLYPVHDLRESYAPT